MSQHIMTTEDFKNKVFKKHGNKVEILSDYKGGTEPINFVYHCNKHGDKYKTINAKNIMSKSFQPCNECNLEIKSKRGKGKKTKNKKYYYDKLKEKVESKGGVLLSEEWTTAKDNYKIICENGHTFVTTADCINSKNQWCPYCYGRKGDFEGQINKIIKNKNGELLSHYINQNTHVKVKCNIHNYIWDVLPLNIKKGRWCPICSLPYSEKVVYDYLTNNGHNIKVQYTFDDLRSENNEMLKFDFAILDINNKLLGLLEVDDNEHRYNTKQPRRLKARERDRLKDKYCGENNIKLFRLQYDIYAHKNILSYEWYWKYIHNQLSEFLSSICINNTKKERL